MLARLLNTHKHHQITTKSLSRCIMSGADNSCPPAAPAVQQQAEEEPPKARGKKRSHDACNHKQHCRWCKNKMQGKCKWLPADCDACRDEHEAAVALAAAAGSSEGGSSTLPPPSPRAMRSAKKARVAEKGQEEEMEEQEERDEEEKEGRKPRFTGEDIRDYRGEVERHHVFAATFADLLPPQEGPLSNYWKQKFEGMEQEIKHMRITYAKLITCVFPSVFTLLPFFLKFCFSYSSLLLPTPTILKTGKGR